jgi:hypothetical protein
VLVPVESARIQARYTNSSPLIVSLAMYSRRRSSLLFGIVPTPRVGTSLSSLLLLLENEVSLEPLAVSSSVMRFGAGVHQSISSAPSSTRFPSRTSNVDGVSARTGADAIWVMGANGPTTMFRRNATRMGSARKGFARVLMLGCPLGTGPVVCRRPVVDEPINEKSFGRALVPLRSRIRIRTVRAAAPADP